MELMWCGVLAWRWYGVLRWAGSCRQTDTQHCAMSVSARERGVQSWYRYRYRYKCRCRCRYIGRNRGYGEVMHIDVDSLFG